MSDMFSSCNSLTNIHLSFFNNQNANDLSYIFSGCNALSNIDLSNFNTKIILICVICSLDAIL